MAIIAVPRPLRDKLGEEAADAPVQVLNQVTEDNRANTLLFVEEKFERRLSEEMSRVNQRITGKIGGINERITEQTSRLEQTLSAMQPNPIEWMFIFTVSHVVIMSGIVFVMLRFSIA